jgi:branched-chain amino acid transport system permease protein
VSVAKTGVNPPDTEPGRQGTGRGQRGRSGRTWLKRVILAVVVGLLAAAPLATGSPYWVTVGVEAVILAIIGMAANITLGKAGFLDLGPAIYFGIGGYTVAICWQNDIPLAAALVLAVLLCFFLGGLVGGLVLRASGVYLGIVLLAFAESMRAAADRNILGLTGGENGRLISGLPRWLNVNTSPETFYIAALVVLAMVLLGVRTLSDSMLGWTWDGIRNNPVRVASSGINVRRQGAVAFAIAGALAGLAGTLFALSLQIASPEMFSIAILVQVLLIVIIGGPGSLWGPVFGAVFVRVVPASLDVLERQGLADPLPDLLHRMVTSHLFALGVIYIVVVMYMPGGFASLRFETLRTLGRARRSADASPETTEPPETGVRKETQ